MSKEQFSQEESWALTYAISKLSEEDQKQISAAGSINDEQCKKIKDIFDDSPVDLLCEVHLCYGMPILSAEKRKPTFGGDLNDSDIN